MLGIVRYILRQLAIGMVLVTIGLTGILWLTQSLRFVELTVNKGASIGVFLKLTLLVMPNFLTVILPVSLFAVVLFTYNKLIADRELVVLRAAGLSHWTLAQPALILAAISTVLGFALNIWIIPKAVEEFHQLQWALRSSATNVMLQEGQFNQIGTGLTVYVRARSPAGELLGIIVYDRRNPLHTVTLMAERGALIKTDNGTPKVLMINGTREQVAHDTHRLSLLYFDNYAMEFSDSSDTGEERSRDARERSTAELFSVTEAQVGPTAFRQFRVEGHQRLASPLYHFSFALLATACLLAGWFNRRGQTDRLVLAIGLMVGIQAMALGVSNLATRDLALVPLVYLAPLIPAVGGGLGSVAPGTEKGDDGRRSSPGRSFQRLSGVPVLPRRLPSLLLAVASTISWAVPADAQQAQTDKATAADGAATAQPPRKETPRPRRRSGPRPENQPALISADELNHDRDPEYRHRPRPCGNRAGRADPAGRHPVLQSEAGRDHRHRQCQPDRGDRRSDLRRLSRTHRRHADRHREGNPGADAR